MGPCLTPTSSKNGNEQCEITLLRFKKKKQKTTSWRCVECAGAGTRLPGFESVLHLWLSRKTCHTFPIKMGIIIASTSLVIMEVEGTNSRSTLGTVSGLLQFRQLAVLFFKTATPPLRTGWCFGHSCALEVHRHL